MKVLVTGGAGYVGGVSVDAILAAGHEVVVLDDLSTGHARPSHPAARLVTGSYGDEAATRALLEAERVDAILHCAARSLVGESVADPAKYYRDNVAGGDRAARGRPGGGRPARRLLLDRGRLRRPRTRRRSPRTRRSARSTPTARRSARSRARSAGTAARTGSGA